ncbi:MAG: NfeD family protein [Candidatus Syntrophopropionicum ammoniitolerans]
MGKEGTAFTPLRPAGTAEVAGQRLDVVTEGEFIHSGMQIRVIKVENIRIVVKEIAAAK